MEENKLFINKSIELHLFFMRIIEEHLIFIQSALYPKNTDISKKIKELREKMLEFLSEIISISNGHISQNIIDFNELITRYTYEAEKLNEYYTGVDNNTNITLLESSILAKSNTTTSEVSNEKMVDLNNRALNIINETIDLETTLFTDILECNIATRTFPDKVDHMIDETKRYKLNLVQVQNMDIIPTLNSVNEEMMLWNDNLSDHCVFASHLLDPKEKEKIHISNEFGEIFRKLFYEAKNARANTNDIIDVLNRSLLESIKYKKVSTKLLENLLYCKVKSTILPLTADHNLRELNHYIRILSDAKKHLDVYKNI